MSAQKHIPHTTVSALRVCHMQARRQRQRRALAQSHIRPGYGPPMPGPMFPSRGPTYPPNIIGAPCCLI